jgi:autotransporter-associated beta strand protein
MKLNRLPFRWFILACVLGSLAPVRATVIYWLGNGSSTATRNWGSTASNWSTNSSGGGNNQLPNFATGADDLIFGNYVASENTLNERPTNSCAVHSLTFTCNGWLTVINTSSTDKIILGAGGITNNPGNITGTDTGNNVPNPPINEFRCQMVLSANATIWNMDTSQQIKLRTLDNLTTNSFLDLSTYTLTLDGPGTNSFSTPTIGTHYGGNIKGTGGIIKNGTGSTSFSATNTYTGPTKVNAGQLIVKTWSSGGGSYTVADGANLQVLVGSPGTTLNVSSLSLTNSAGTANTNTLAIGLGSFGNPTAPVINATNLNLNGNIYVTVLGSGLSPGTIPLIQYGGSITGGGTMLTNLLPTGVGAYLTNNTGLKQWQLVVTYVPSLVWAGKTNNVLTGTWDVGITTNWFDSTALTPAYFSGGLPVLFNDAAATNLVTLATNVTPFSMTFSNNTLTYTLTNDGINGYQAIPSQGLIKDGTGLLVIGTTNSYTGFTYIKQGTLKTAIANAIGRGLGNSGAALTNNGTLDLNGFAQNIGVLYGSGVITNSSSTPVTLQTQAGGVDGGTFTGQINEGSGGAIKLVKSGGELTMNGHNNYSGGTYFITGGAGASRWIILGGDNVLGTGPVVFQILATLTPDVSPRLLTNSVSIQNVNSSFSLGNTGAGQLTLSGPFDINTPAGLDQTITCASDVVLTGPFTTTLGGVTVKDGAGTMRLLNNNCNWFNQTSDARVNDGTLVIDGATVSLTGLSAPTFRVQSQLTNGLANLFITNNGALTVGNVNGYYRLRLGDTTSGPGSTNVADIRGTLIADGVTLGYSGSTITTNNPGPSETYTTNWNGGGAYARLNLQPGSQATLSQISASPTKTITEVYFDGATINAIDNSSSSFLQGLTNVFVMNGGLTLNGANTNSIHIRQNLLEGSPGGGGLTWNGTNSTVPTACILQLDGTNTYTGTTAINVGTLGGIGTLSGPLVLASGTSLYPGGGGNVGTFTVNNNVTLNSGSHCSFELNITNSLLQTDGTTYTNYIPLSNTNDMLVVGGSLNVSGASLAVNNLGPALTNGYYFKLFSKPAVGFGSIALPALDPSLMWQTNLAVDGSIAVVSTNTVVVTPPTLNVAQSGNALTFSWSNGAGSFHLQSQTNALNAGLGSTWYNYPGGGSSPVNVNINPANPTVFFRLSQ